MKGKKFNAAEKHFRQKELKYRSDIKFCKEELSIISIDNIKLIDENKALTKELNELKEKYERLLEYSKLTDTDIEYSLKRDKSIVNFSEMIKIMRG